MCAPENSPQLLASKITYSSSEGSPQSPPKWFKAGY